MKSSFFVRNLIKVGFFVLLFQFFSFSCLAKFNLYVSGTADDGTTVTATVPINLDNSSSLFDILINTQNTVNQVVGAINQYGADAVIDYIDENVVGTGDGDHNVGGGNGNYSCDNGANFEINPVDPSYPDPEPYIPDHGPYDPYVPTCDNNCNQASDHCLGSGYYNDCGNYCSGTKEPDCSDRNQYCLGQTFPSSNGCGDCVGTKPLLSGSCGDATKKPTCSKPETNLCSLGSASSVESEGDYWKWTCNGICGGSPAPCSVRKECPWIETGN